MCVCVCMCSHVTWKTGNCRCTLRSTVRGKRTWTETVWRCGTQKSAWRTVTHRSLRWHKGFGINLSVRIIPAFSTDIFPGPVFGNKDFFTGLGVFVDTYPNEEKHIEVWFFVFLTINSMPSLIWLLLCNIRKE